MCNTKTLCCFSVELQTLTDFISIQSTYFQCTEQAMIYSRYTIFDNMNENTLIYLIYYDDNLRIWIPHCMFGIQIHNLPYTSIIG